MSTAELEPIKAELVAGNIEAPIRFNVTNEAISCLRKKLSGLKANTTEGYKLVQAGIAETRSLRVSIETTRKALKEKALTYGRLVDGEAKRITNLLEEIEEPLKLEKEVADAAKAKAKAETEEAKKRAMQQRIDSLVAAGAMVHPLIVQEWSDDQFQDQLTKATEAFKFAQEKLEADKAEAARLEAERAEQLRIEQEKLTAERAELEKLRAEAKAREEADQAARRVELEKIEAEQAAERKRLADEQAKIDEQNRFEREAIEAERIKLHAEKDRIEREEFLRQTQIRQEQEAADRAEQERIEAERIKAEQIENDRLAAIAERERLVRLEALKPDAEKLRTLGDVLRLLSYPEMSTPEGQQCLSNIIRRLGETAEYCEDCLELPTNE